MGLLEPVTRTFCEQLVEEMRGQDVVDAVPESPDNSPQLDLYRGLIGRADTPRG